MRCAHRQLWWTEVITNSLTAPDPVGGGDLRRGKATLCVAVPITAESASVCLRLRRLPPRPPHRPDRLPLRAAEWRHEEAELAAHDLLQHFDSLDGLFQGIVADMVGGCPRSGCDD